MAMQKNDFIEISYTGKSDGKIFDTTNKDEAKEIGLDIEVKPLIIAVGNNMLLKGFDEALIGKEIEKKYSIHLEPEKAFGIRNPNLIKTYSLNSFKKNNINPYPGLTLQLDNSIAIVRSVTGGRVMVDFNNPLAGKEVDYEFTIKRKVEDENEKINALQDYFFRQRFEFSIKDKKVVFKDNVVKVFLDLLGEKFKEITGMEFVIEEQKKDKEDIKEKLKEDKEDVKEKKKGKKKEEKKETNKEKTKEDKENKKENNKT
ncbi:peptidylprolyl isomerase [Candidatus Pacearchaeota archaeon]|nr:peptidylprolyl isomerase [Candidatus Pacearchaeota archaeon]